MKKNIRPTVSGLGTLSPPHGKYGWFSLKLLLCAVGFVAGIMGSQSALGGEATAITQFKLSKEGVLSVAWTATTNKVTVQLSPSLTSPDWQAVTGGDWPITGTNWTGAIPRERSSSYLRLVSYLPGGTFLPSKTISLDVIGIHDSGSAAYNADCLSCHGDRTKEVALDGKTPAAHATMVGFFGKGNQACLKCHTPKPDFLTHSGGGLWNQIDRLKAGCFTCHGPGSDKLFYAK